MYRPFSRRGKLHHVLDFVPSWAAWRGRGGIRSGGHGFRPRVGRPADLVRDLREGRGRGFWAGQGRGSGMRERVIVADRFQNFIVAAKVAEKSPESRKTSGGFS